jgi:hypothetical protein
MNDLIKQAIEKYEAYEAAREAEQQARQQTDRQEAEKEVEEMCQFLGTLMPQGLVQYANLDGYRREYSSRFRSDSSNGVVVWVQPPDCFPVWIRVYHDGDKLRHEPERWSHSGPKFTVPTLASVRADEYGDEGYYIQFDGSEAFDDFATALGYAAVRGVELAPLKKEIEERKQADADPSLAGFEKVAAPVMSPQERIAIALENIADGIAALHLYN